MQKKKGWTSERERGTDASTRGEERKGIGKKESEGRDGREAAGMHGCMCAALGAQGAAAC